jgi:hypothetical protein
MAMVYTIGEAEEAMEGVHGDFQAYFYEYFATHEGARPSRATMLGAPQLAHVPQHVIRRSWELLTAVGGHRTPHDPEEVPMELDDDLTELAALDAQRQRRIAGLAREVRELRGLVMALSPAAAAKPEELVQTVGKLAATVAMLTTQLQRVAEQQKVLEQTLATLQQPMQFLQGLRQLLAANDEVWETLKAIIQQHDRPFATKSLRNTLASWAGRPLHIQNM